MSRLLVFEIATEEIPSAPLYDAVAQLKADAEEAFRHARLEYGEVAAYGTPRRLALVVSELAERQEDRTERAKGPALQAAFDSEGHPTKAAEGFARGKGVAVEDLERVEDESGAYVYAVIDRPGHPAVEVLPELLAGLAAGIEWPKSMRWGDGETRFSRPVRRLLALFGPDIVPVEFAGLVAGRETIGHRFLAPEPLDVPNAEEYEHAMRRGSVALDQAERAREIREGIAAAAAGRRASAVVPEKTFGEVVNLVEWPTVGVGEFDAEFLEVPREVLETAMESHQRYFPLEANGKLLPNFVVVHNGNPDRTEAIVAGHERVIRARLADAAFFYREDLGISSEDRAEQLSTIVFQERLGSLAAKVTRVERLVGRLAQQAAVPADVTAYALRAAHLAKADLVSQVVVEFPALQGVMGSYYALAEGEGPGVAEAIVEHYQPRFAGDELPASTAGKLVSVADKLDTMVGMFAIGMPPTGSADPYALRRGAIGILAIVIDGGLALRLDAAIEAALDGFSGVVGGLDFDTTGSAVRDFILGRLDGMLRERGFAYDTVAAVLATSGDDPAEALARVASLQTARDERPDVFGDLAVAFSRARNLCEPSLGVATDTGIMGPEERALADALAEAERTFREALDAGSHGAALEVLASLRAPVDAFFEAVLVMDPDEQVRANRLRLLNRFVALFEGFADFGKLEG